MVKTVLGLFFLMLFAWGCENELQIQQEGFKTTPSVYCLINPLDSIHYIRLGRVFSSSGNPKHSGQVSDSIYFDQALVRILLVSTKGDSTWMEASRTNEIAKEVGFFGTDEHAVYVFEKKMAHRGFSLYKSIEIEIEIPGLPIARGRSEFLERALVRWPYVAQEYLFVDQERPILVQWYGADWNEVDITFTIMEQYRDTTLMKSISFEEKTEIHLLEGVVQVTFPYELVVSNFSRILKVDQNLIRRYFGPVYIRIHCGNADFLRYMDTKDGINDFNGQAVSNIENAIGFIACKWTTEIRPLYFDYFTRLKFASDPDLKKFKFIEY